jgi:hypothetical protein
LHPLEQVGQGGFRVIYREARVGGNNKCGGVPSRPGGVDTNHLRVEIYSTEGTRGFSDHTVMLGVEIRPAPVSHPTDCGQRDGAGDSDQHEHRQDARSRQT